jgi:hypothetical protein
VSLGEVAQDGDRVRHGLRVGIADDDERRARLSDAAVRVHGEAGRPLVLEHAYAWTTVRPRLFTTTSSSTCGISASRQRELRQKLVNDDLRRSQQLSVDVDCAPAPLQPS